MTTRLCFASIVLMFFVLLAPATAQQSLPPPLTGDPAAITNGFGIYLGVNDYGHLNIYDSVIQTSNAGYLGLAVVADLSAYGRGTGPGLWDATSPGCLCEGWGVSVNGAIGGGADVAAGGIDNLGLVSFASTTSTATSVTTLMSTPLQITQAYAPSISHALFEDTVTLLNTSATDTLSDVTYRRVMDWDVPPNEFNEFVTNQGWGATNLINMTDNGFQVPNPLVAPGVVVCAANTNVTYCGPYDHGALFDFGFGSLSPGESKTFSIFYGATFNHADAMAALGTVGAEVYSLGNWGGDTNQTGAPITYIFGFKGVGGTPVPPVPEPGTLAVLAGLLGSLGVIRRRWSS